MQIKLLSADAPRPDARAITKMLEEIAGLSNYDARDTTDILLDGTEVEIEVASKNLSSAYRMLRKLQVDYEIME